MYVDHDAQTHKHRSFPSHNCPHFACAIHQHGVTQVYTQEDSKFRDFDESFTEMMEWELYFIVWIMPMFNLARVSAL